SYRFVREDLAAAGPPEPDQYFGPLRDLPIGVVFQAPGAGPFKGLRFNRLGGDCQPTVGNCGGDPFAGGADTICTAAENTAPTGRCVDQAVASYIGAAPVGPDFQITLLEQETGLTRTVRIASGGRVISEAQ